MRMNHRRGIVNNFVVAQNPRDLRPGGTSHKRDLYCGLWWATGIEMA
jgi:hypothetical protein